MSAVRHEVHTNLGLDVTAVEVEHEAHAARPAHVAPDGPRLPVAGSDNDTLELSRMGIGN